MQVSSTKTGILVDPSHIWTEESYSYRKQVHLKGAEDTIGPK